MTEAFGSRYREKIPGLETVIGYKPEAQTSNLSDQELQALAASDNTLTFTGGNDNDFDE